MSKQPCVYILASKRNGTLYTGVTSDLIKRVWEHKNNVVEGFTSKHNVHTLVWYELHELMLSAIEREKSIKNWTREDKLKLIESANPVWTDLYDSIIWKTIANDVKSLKVSGFRHSPEWRFIEMRSLMSFSTLTRQGSGDEARKYQNICHFGGCWNPESMITAPSIMADTTVQSSA